MSFREEYDTLGNEVNDSDVVVKVNKKMFDVVYSDSPYVIVREIPFLGKRFILAKLIDNKDVRNSYRQTGLNSKEFFDLYSDNSVGPKEKEILSYKFKFYRNTGSLKLTIGYHYHILLHGLINTKEHIVSSNKNYEIKFETLYEYHLVDAKKFLKFYQSKKNVTVNQDVWDAMQDEIRITLDKEIINFVINEDPLELNKKYNTYTFDKVLSKLNVDIVRRYGIYIDRAYLNNLQLPEKIKDAAAEIDASAMRKEAQKDVAQIEGEIAEIKADFDANVERKKMISEAKTANDINKIFKNTTGYNDYLRARNSKVYVNNTMGTPINEQVKNNSEPPTIIIKQSTSPKIDNGQSQKMPVKNFMDESGYTMHLSNGEVINCSEDDYSNDLDEYPQNELSKEVINDRIKKLYAFGLCDEYGYLDCEKINEILGYKSFSSTVGELNQMEFIELMEKGYLYQVSNKTR